MAPDRRLHILFPAFLEGFIVMAIQISAGLFVGLHCGSSLEVWAIVLASAMAGLATGYLIAAFRPGHAGTHLEIHFLSAGFIPVLVMTVIESGYVPIVLNPLPMAFLLSFPLLFLPLALLGQIIPMLVAKNKQLQPGKLFAVSTFGAFLSAYAVGFGLLPAFGAGIALGLVCLFALCWVLIQVRQMHARFGHLAISGLTVVAMLLPKAQTGTILFDETGILGRVAVTQENDVQTLFMNGLPQSVIGIPDSCSRLKYAHQISVLASIYPSSSQSLVLGIGGGTVVRELRGLGHQVTGCELNPLVHAAADRFFGTSGAHIQHDDARHFIRSLDRNYSFIVLDCFFGESPPWHVLTLEAIRELSAHLQPNGMLVVYFPHSESENGRIATRMMQATLQQAGLEVSVMANAGKAAGQLLISTFQPFSYETYAPFHLTKCATGSGVSLRLPYASVPRINEVCFRDDFPLLESMIGPATIRRWPN